MINEIHTQFYSDEFAYLLKKFYTYIEDGDFRRNYRRNVSCASIDHDPNGEVVIRIKNEARNTVYERKQSVAVILKWLGGMLKCQTQRMFYRKGTNMNTQWNRGNFDTLIDFLSDDNHKIYVGDIYYIYDVLMCHKNIDKYYDRMVIEKWRGKQNDPITTEAERIRREEIKKIEAEYDEKIKNCSYEDYKYHWGQRTIAKDEMYAKYREIMDAAEEKILQMENEFGRKWDMARYQLQVEKAEKLKEINDSVNTMKMLGI